MDKISYKEGNVLFNDTFNTFYLWCTQYILFMVIWASAKISYKIRVSLGYRVRGSGLYLRTWLRSELYLELRERQTHWAVVMVISGAGCMAVTNVHPHRPWLYLVLGVWQWPMSTHTDDGYIWCWVYGSDQCPPTQTVVISGAGCMAVTNGHPHRPWLHLVLGVWQWPMVTHTDRGYIWCWVYGSDQCPPTQMMVISGAGCMAVTNGHPHRPWLHLVLGVWQWPMVTHTDRGYIWCWVYGSDQCPPTQTMVISGAGCMAVTNVHPHRRWLYLVLGVWQWPMSTHTDDGYIWCWVYGSDQCPPTQTMVISGAGCMAVTNVHPHRRWLYLVLGVWQWPMSTHTDDGYIWCWVYGSDQCPPTQMMVISGAGCMAVTNGHPHRRWLYLVLGVWLYLVLGVWLWPMSTYTDRQLGMTSETSAAPRTYFLSHGPELCPQGMSTFDWWDLNSVMWD